MSLLAETSLQKPRVEPPRHPLPLTPALHTGPGDRYFDYCLQPYQPRHQTAGKLRSENVLWYSLQLAGLLEQARPPLLALQAALGRDMTVWGVKWDGQRLFWEFYFYDPRKQDPAATLSGLRETLAPWLTFAPQVAETVPYMMVSFDLDAEILAQGRVDSVNLYLTGSELHEGRSYKVWGDGRRELDNTYRFLQPKPEVDVMLGLLTSSLWVDYSDARTLAKVLIPELYVCKRVCVAKKRLRDGVYFSGLDIDQLLFALKRFGYPAALVDYVGRHAESLDHIFWDVGVDYDPDGAGGITYPKTSIYGTL